MKLQQWSVLLVTSLLLLAQGVLAEPKLSKIEKKRHADILAQTPVFDSPKLQVYLDRVGKKVVDVSVHSDREYQFVLLDDPIPNAFNAGYDVVYVTRGLLALLNSEAQLAGVLAHEIGHNIGQHGPRNVRRIKVGNFFANVASILVGNSAVGQSIAQENAVYAFEFRRENELEADRYAAEYMYAANYEPTQMIDALSGLADFGSFAGKGAPYHGLFSTHPRTDSRRKGIVESVGELPPGEAFLGRDEYRDAVEGLLYGPNYTDNVPQGYERYTNESLSITFLHPKDWTRTIKGSKIILKDAADTLQMKIAIEKTVDKKASSEDTIRAKFPDDLTDVEKIDEKATRDLGVVAKRPNQRVGLVKVARNTFNFQGIAKNNNISAEADEFFVWMIKNFRRMTPQDRTKTEVTRIFYERLEPGETFAAIAAETDKGQVKAEGTEELLRIINGYYPRGEAEPGTWIKKLKKVKVSTQGTADVADQRP